VLAAGPAALSTIPALAGLPAPAGRGDDAQLLSLFHELRAAWAKENRLQHDEAGKLEEAYQRCSAIVAQIERCHPTTLQGFQVKAIAVLWCHSGDLTLEFSEHQTTRCPTCAVDRARSDLRSHS